MQQLKISKSLNFAFPSVGPLLNAAAACLPLPTNTSVPLPYQLRFSWVSFPDVPFYCFSCFSSPDVWTSLHVDMAERAGIYSGLPTSAQSECVIPSVLQFW